jgi:hypothetical protein
VPPSVKDWSWSWGPPGSLPDFHDFGDNMFWDIIRLGVVIASAILVMGCGRVLVEERRRKLRMPTTQKCRFYSLMFAAMYMGGMEAWVMGTTATPRLLLAIVVVTLGLCGVWGIRKKQLRTPVTEGF